ncbi:MAG: hypothetical protein LBD41_04595 [Clostridiales Family XIII bacterium]|jgi:adenine-specific DNA-methyltransferase|nr:hypothetical protein [Clostridiales Family XIII bacterium]
MILFYAKNENSSIVNGVRINYTAIELDKKFTETDEYRGKYNAVLVHALSETTSKDTGKEWKGMLPLKSRHRRNSPKELTSLDKEDSIEWSKNRIPRMKKYADEYNMKKDQNVLEFIEPNYLSYPTQKKLEMLKMIIEQSSDVNSIVLDCFAGSGQTLLVPEKLNIKWIGIDESDFYENDTKSRFGNIDYTSIYFNKEKTDDTVYKESVSENIGMNI